ncbi:MAG TPA: Rid family hydrolase [Alphaproteobacteria bacterium]|jgi:enamine deaminase RidA (YjgF/YER057c/UK114 family)
MAKQAKKRAAKAVKATIKTGSRTAKKPTKRAKPAARKKAAKRSKTPSKAARTPIRREIVHIPGGRKHGNPVPSCIRMANMVFSASIAGQDVNDVASPDPATQIADAFVNLRKTVEAAGGTTASIARINFYVPDMGQRTHINKEWLAMFPDENDRPVRKVYPMEVPHGLFLQMDFIAVL